MEDALKRHDQYGQLVSEVDILLLNEFTTLELCKLNIDFVAILSLKKEYLKDSFDN